MVKKNSDSEVEQTAESYHARYLSTGDENAKQQHLIATAWVEAEPSNVYAWYCLGEARRTMGDHKAALSAFQTADRLRPDDPATVGRMAELLLELDDYGQSNQQYRRVLTLFADPPFWTFVGLGNSYEKLDQHDKALSAFLQAAAIGSNNNDLKRRIINCFKRLGRDDRKEFAESVLHLMEANEGAGELLEIQGRFEEESLVIEGYASRVHDSSPCYVTASINGTVLAPILSNQHAPYLAANFPELLEYCGFSFTLSEPEIKELGAELQIEVRIAGGAACREFRLCPVHNTRDTDNAQHGYARQKTAPNIAFCEQNVISSYQRDANLTIDDPPAHCTKLALCCSYFETDSWPRRNRALYRYFKENNYFVVNVHALGAGKLKDIFCNHSIDLSILKTNAGYDFGSWLCAFYKTVEHWPKFSHVVFANDSNIGPLQSNASALSSFVEVQRNFFGLTDSFGHNYHVQSYFFGLGPHPRERLIISDFFRYLQPTSNKPDVIGTGELAMGRDLVSRGGVISVMCPYTALASKFVARARVDIGRLVKARSYYDNTPNNRLLQSIEARLTWIEQKCSDLSAGIAHNPHAFVLEGANCRFKITLH